LGLTGPLPRRQTQTVGPRRTLQSPVRLSRSGTQKRRHTQSGVPRKRPSIGSELWLDPSSGAASKSSSSTTTTTTPTVTSSHSEKVEVAPSRSNQISIPKIPSVPTLSSSASMPNVGGQYDDSELLPPPRL